MQKKKVFNNSQFNNLSVKGCHSEQKEASNNNDLTHNRLTECAL